MIYCNETDGKVAIEFGPALKAIVLGLRFEQSLLPSVVHFANSIPIYKPEWDKQLGLLQIKN